MSAKILEQKAVGLLSSELREVARELRFVLKNKDKIEQDEVCLLLNLVHKALYHLILDPSAPLFLLCDEVAEKDDE